MANKLVKNPWSSPDYGFVNCIHDVVYNGLCLWYRNSGNVTHSLWLYLLSQKTIICPVLATVASSKGRGEQWAEPLVQLATKPQDVAKTHKACTCTKHVHFL